ncbi:m7GpppX diphosphatase [Physcia stellaris]|nr:m7GpppX diphosphatase [Physcia stellaris]
MGSATAEALIPQFKLEKLLNQDQAGRRITLLGSIDSSKALLTVERAAFPNDPEILKSFHEALANIKNLGDNDIYRWYLACSGASDGAPSDLKLNLIYPCTEAHIRKYSPQGVRMVTETADIYKNHIHPYMRKKRDEGRLNWVFNIIEGRTEQEDVILRDNGQGSADDAFLMLPDLNWDRKTITSLHLLGLVERRDIWSLRDLKKSHTPWLKHMREKMLDATVGLYKEVEKDQLKLYVHYQPTYYHFHVHIVHAQLEAGSTQSVGKAFGLENIISQLETMSGGPEAGMADVSLTYYLGEANELWTDIFEPLKRGEKS